MLGLGTFLRLFQMGASQPGAGRPSEGITPPGLLQALIQLLQKRAAS